MLKIKLLQVFAARVAVLMSAAATAAVPASASAPVGSGYTLAIRGEVPVICRASVSSFGNRGGADGYTGELIEFCNSAGGYAVYAQLSGHGRETKILIDGEALTPDESGAVLLSQSSHANIAARKLQVAGVVEGTTLSLEIVPL